MTYFRVLFAVVLLFVAGAPMASAAYFEQREVVTLTQNPADDAFIGGEKISINVPVGGEIFAFGGDVFINEAPLRSVFAAARNITLEKGSNYNAFLVGSTVRVKGVVEHDVYIAARHVIIDSTAKIKGSLNIVAAESEVAGTIDGDLTISGSSIKSAANVIGSVRFIGDTVQFSKSSIGKDLTIEGAETVSGLNDVTVGGQTKQITRHNDDRSAFRLWLMQFLALLVSGAAFLLLFRRSIEVVNSQIVFRWGGAFSLGLALFILFPIAAALLFASEVGALLGVAVLALFVVTLIAAVVLAYIVFGNLLLTLAGQTKRNWWQALVVGVLVMTLLQLIPLPAITSTIMIVFFFGLIIPSFGSLLVWVRQSLGKEK